MVIRKEAKSVETSYCPRRKSTLLVAIPGGGAGGEGSQPIFIRGGSAPKSDPLTLWYTIFGTKYPFSIPSIEKWCFSHTPCLDLCINFNCCKCTLWSYKQTSNRDVFWTFSQPWNSSLNPVGPFYRLKWQSSDPFHIHKTWKGIPFGWSLPP